MSLKDRFSEPGFVVSALVHVGALAATLIAFSHTEKFDDLQETVPVEVVTDNQFNQIMKGDKSAKEVRPEAATQPEQVASRAVEPPDQPTPEKPQTAPPPPPPPPPPPMPPVRQAEPPKPPAPAPPPVAVLPPTRPEPPAPAPTPPVPMPPVRDVAEEPAPPKPVPKPVPKPPVVKPVPTPPVVPHPVVAKLPDPKPAPRPHPADKPKVDQLAKLMEDLPTQTAPAVHPAVSKAKEAAPAEQTSTFDLSNIAKLLSGGPPAQRPAASQQASRVASLGSPTASAAKMSPSFWAGLDGVMEDQYRQCWSYLGLNTGVKYVPQVRVVYSPAGSLEGEPVLINPPSDPALRTLAESAMRAVRRCNPLKIPDQYAPYYNEWKGRVLRFDPEEMAG